MNLQFKTIHKLLIFSSLSLIHTAHAAPPFITDDADITPYHHTEIYFFSATQKNNQGTVLAFPALELDYGLKPRLEVDAILPYVSSSPHDHETSTSGIGDGRIALKYQFLTETNVYPQAAFEPTYIMPTGNANRRLGNGRAWAQLPIWLQKSWNTWSMYGGGGYAANDEPGMRNYFFGGAVLTKNVTDKLLLGIELYMQGADSHSTYAFKLLNVGGEYSMTKKINLVAGIGHTVVGDVNTYTYLGIHVFL